MYYKQCDLQKGNKKQTTWIPEKFAKKGKILKLKEGDAWEDGWEVMFVGAVKSEEDLKNFKDLFRYHREATDI